MKARLPGRSPVVKHNFVCICVHSRDPRISKTNSIAVRQMHPGCLRSFGSRNG